MNVIEDIGLFSDADDSVLLSCFTVIGNSVLVDGNGLFSDADDSVLLLTDGAASGGGGEAPTVEISDAIPLITDSITSSLVRAWIVAIHDSLNPIQDALFPPPVEAVHRSGSIADNLQVIADAISIQRNRAYVASISDSIPLITDSIAAGKINLEKPGRWIAPVTITPKSASIDPLHLAAHPVRHPGKYFAPKIKSYGTFTRAISAPVGFIKTGDVSLSVIDANNEIRRGIATKTIRKADAEMRLGPEGERLSAFLRPWKRRVGTVTQPSDGELNITLQDHVFEFLEKTIQGCVNEDNFPNMPEGAGSEFVPIPIGIVASEKGAYRVPLVDTVNHRYAVSRNPIVSVDAVYRKGSGDDDFVLVAPSEYTLRQDVYIDHGEGSGDNCALLEFAADQGNAEIRVNVHGVCDDDGVLTHTNFADMFLGMFIYLAWANNLTDVLNLASFDETRIACADLQCAGVVTQAITWGELISQVQRSSNIDVFADKNDRISIHYTTDDEEPVLDLDDGMRLYKGSVSQQLANPTYNRIPYKYAPNYASGKWTEDVWDNPADQAALDEIVDEEPLQMHWVRDAATAEIVAARRGEYLDLDSFRFEGEIPLIPVLEELELANLVSIAHFGGIKAGGYTAEQFKILELAMNIDNLTYHFKGIRRRLPPPELVITEHDTDAEGGDGGGDGTDGSALPNGINGTLAINARIGPHYNNVEGELFAVWRDRVDSSKLKVWRTTNYGASWTTVDTANQPNLAGAIASFDSFAVDGKIHIATQENTSGRVAYHVFDMTTATWETVDEEVVAGLSNNPTSRCVSIETRYPDGEPVVYFQGNRELIEGQYWHRGWYCIKQAGTWSAPAMITPDPGQYPENLSGFAHWDLDSSNCYVQRVVATRENRMHFFYSISPSVHWVMWSPDEYAVTMRADFSTSSRVLINGTGVHYVPERNVGGVAVFDDRSKIAVIRRGGYGVNYIEIFSDEPTLLFVRRYGFDEFSNNSPQTLNPCGFVAEISNTLHAVYSVWDWVKLYLSTDESVAFDAGETCAPVGGDATSTAELNGTVLQLRGHTYLSFFTGSEYRWIRTDILPLTE